MNDNKNLNFDTEALKYLGRAYLKIPRVILDKLFSSNRNERAIGKVHWFLFCFCNYADGYVTIDGQLLFCRRGECFITYETLAQKLEVSRRTVKRHLDTLVGNSLIEVRRIDNHLNLRVCGYEQFTAPEALAKRRTEEEEKTSWGNEPRFDLLNQIYH